MSRSHPVSSAVAVSAPCRPPPVREAGAMVTDFRDAIPSMHADDDQERPPYVT